MYSVLYKKAISTFLKCSEHNIFLYWKGRVALYAFLMSLELNEGDEVILPAFTCVVVPNAILYAGLKPVYVDISPLTFNMDIKLVEGAITDKTKVILCQNTFGLSSNIEELISIAKKYNLITIEDCTHGFGGTYNAKPNGSFCDAAFFSSQWNKPFSTGIGGFLVVNNDNLLTKVKSIDNKKVKPTLFEKFNLFFLLKFRMLFVNKYTQSSLVIIYRFLSKFNLILGSNQGAELDSTLMPQAYLKDISNIQIKKGLRVLKHLNDANDLRKNNARDYTSFLKSKNKNHISEDLFGNHIFLKYPLLVNNREKFFKLARRANITLGDWFLSPLHPIEGTLDKWNFDNKCFPISSNISKKIINLPTDIKNNSWVLKFLDYNLDLIE